MFKNYFKEASRQILLFSVGILLLSFALAFNTLYISGTSPLFIEYFFLNINTLYNPTLCFIAPVILVTVSFSFLKKGGNRDFFDSLPVSRNLFFISKTTAVFLLSLISQTLPFIFSCVAVSAGGLELSFFNVLASALAIIRNTAIGTAAGALAVVIFRKPFMTFAGAVELIFIPYSFVATAITLINRRLPSFGLYDESPAIRFNDFPEIHTLFNGKAVALSILFLAVQILLSAGIVILSGYLYKKKPSDSKMPSIAFYLCLFLPCALLGVLWQTTIIEFSYTVFAILTIICFVPIIIRYKSLKHLIQSVLVCIIVTAVTYFSMFTLPAIYAEYNNTTPVYHNSIKNVEIVESHSPFLESGMKTDDKSLLIDFVKGVTDSSVTGNTIIKIERNNGLPLYRYARYETESEMKIHNALVGSEHLISYIETANERTQRSIHLDFTGTSGFVDIDKQACDSIIGMLKALPSDYWYKMRKNDNLVKMKYGQNSFTLNVDEYSYAISPAIFPEFFDIVNANLKNNEFANALNSGETLENYQLAGYRLTKPLTDEIKNILTAALERDISDMAAQLGAEQFAKGGVWVAETFASYDITPAATYCYHFLPLTEEECKTLTEFFKQ